MWSCTCEAIEQVVVPSGNALGTVGGQAGCLPGYSCKHEATRAATVNVSRAVALKRYHNW